MCVKCHGAKGEGVAGKYDEALVGDRSVVALAKLIEKTMPEDAPGTCRGPDAQRVAAYIYDAFYSPAAQARITAGADPISRLTVGQYRNSVADLFAGLREGGSEKAQEMEGLSAQYLRVAQFQGQAGDRTGGSGGRVRV